MKRLVKHSKIFMFLIDILIIVLAAVFSNLLLCKEEDVFSGENVSMQ